MRRRLIGAVAWVTITAALFLLLEGAASVTVFLRTLQTDVRSLPHPAERKHAVFDAELGWVNRPNLDLEDFYGPGKHLVINSRGFRNRRDFETSVRDEILRVICTGDSYTLGYGVSNENAWCAQLAALASNVESVNMGQGGYGIDQMYLWYMRDGVELEHDVQILAFIDNDFQRMMSRRFAGYSKPVIGFVDGELRARPASPRNGDIRRWLSVNGQLFTQLRSVEFSRRALGRLSSALGATDARERTWSVAEAIFDDLLAGHCERRSELVLVFLPDIPAAEPSAHWRSLVEDYSQRRGVVYFDLVADLQKVSMEQADSFFDEAHGHYTESGNLWVATRLDTWLRQRPSGGRPCE
jgi:hypothetical protein